jgi:lipopolysaccharide transport system ATP-binding protein
MAAISALCNRSVLLSYGKIDYSGSVEETLNKYLANRIIDSTGSINFNGDEPERFGEKKYARWLSIKLHNKNNKISDVFRMGEKMKISLELEINRPSDDFEIGIGIGNLQEVYSHYLVSTWEGFSSIKKTGITMIEVEIPQLFLFPGNYLIILWICIRGAYYDDAIHNAIQFRVEEGKVNQHDTYFERFSKNTQVYTSSNWKIL